MEIFHIQPLLLLFHKKKTQKLDCCRGDLKFNFFFFVQGQTTDFDVQTNPRELFRRLHPGAQHNAPSLAVMPSRLPPS
jgi:hypothetical protein